MLKRTWTGRDHHWFDKPTRRGKSYMEVVYGNYTTHMKGTAHLQAHRDTKEVGPIGARARYECNRILAGEGFLLF